MIVPFWEYSFRPQIHGSQAQVLLSRKKTHETCCTKQCGDLEEAAPEKGYQRNDIIEEASAGLRFALPWHGRSRSLAQEISHPSCIAR